MTRLGVGKNMVRSIRHWCLATRVLEEIADGKGHRLVPTPWGESLLSDDGFDPFLEDIGSLWLIHWKLASNKEKSTTWFLIFGCWNQPEFTKDGIATFISQQLHDNAIKHVANVSIERDVTCFIRTYVPTKRSNIVLLEDSLDCPLIELQFINVLADGKTFQISRRGHTLPDIILAYMIAEYWVQYYPHQRTLSFEDLMYRPGSPGRVTRLEENAMTERLDRMDEITRGAFYFDSSAGLRQLYRGNRPFTNPNELLEEYYGGARRDDSVVAHSC